MKRWKIGLVMATLLVVIVTPTVASARGFWCVGDPVIKINGVRTDIVIEMELAARDVMRSEGKSVLVTVAVPRDFNYRLLKVDQTIPTRLQFKRTGADDVMVFVRSPDLRGYGDYSIQVTVEVHSAGWSESSGEVRRQAPKARIRIPGDLFEIDD